MLFVCFNLFANSVACALHQLLYKIFKYYWLNLLNKFLNFSQTITMTVFLQFNSHFLCSWSQLCVLCITTFYLTGLKEWLFCGISIVNYDFKYCSKSKTRSPYCSCISAFDERIYSWCFYSVMMCYRLDTNMVLKGKFSITWIESAMWLVYWRKRPLGI